MSKRTRKRKKWTDREINYLKEKWGNMTISAIARNLGRSVNSITLKAHRLEVGAFFEAGNLVLLKEVVEALGYYYVDTIVDKLKKHDCPIQYIKLKQRSYRKIDLDEFWAWAEQHKDVISFRNFEKYALGGEPEWVDEKRKLDRKTPEKKYTHWTTEEERLLISKAKSGRYDLLKLSLEFNRTKAAVRNKLFQLGCKASYDNRIAMKYTEIEENKILQMKEAGYTFKHIANELQRSRAGVAWKYKQLIDSLEVA